MTRAALLSNFAWISPSLNGSRGEPRGASRQNIRRSPPVVSISARAWTARLMHKTIGTVLQNRRLCAGLQDEIAKFRTPRRHGGRTQEGGLP